MPRLAAHREDQPRDNSGAHRVAPLQNDNPGINLNSTSTIEPSQHAQSVEGSARSQKAGNAFSPMLVSSLLQRAGETLSERAAETFSERATLLLSKFIFVSLLCIIVFTALPYGTDGTRWEAPFEIAVYLLGILAVLDGLLRRDFPPRPNELTIVMPLIGLLLLALIQIIPLSGTPFAGPHAFGRHSVSADPYETKLFIFKLLALIITAVLVHKYCATSFRLRTLIRTIIVLGVASALFGILRQNAQHSSGFILPGLDPGEGYAQFFNRNHFAFLMEMALGLCLGLVASHSVTRDRVLIYIGLASPMWAAVIFSTSRGGVLAIFAQLIIVTIFWSKVQRPAQNFAVLGTWQRLTTLSSSTTFRAIMLLPLLSLFAVTIFWVGGEPLSKRLQAIEISEGGATISEVARDSEATDLREKTTRFDIWKATLRMIAANPVAGVGFAGYSVAISEYHDASGISVPREAHNDYLELWASGGLLGSILAAWFGIVLARRSRQVLHSESRLRRGACLGALTGIFAVSIHSFVDFGLHITINALVFMILAIIATIDLKTTNREVQKITH